MEWVRAHPYACTIFAVCVLIIVGIVVIKTHSALATPTGLSAWSGGSEGALVNSTASQTLVTATSSASPQVNNSAIDTGTLPYGTPTENPLAQGGSASSEQLSALLAELSHPSGQTSSSVGAQASSSAAVANAYAFIPSGTIAVNGTSGQNYTGTQESLYIYGNAAGTYIQSYDQNDSDQAQILTDSVQSRQDQTKSQAVEQVGSDLVAVGKHLSEISDIPAQAQADNAALAQSYEATGAALEKVAAATNESDTDFVAAMQAYDSTANTLVQHYAALALVFSANGVSFNSTDPGSVFSFNTNAGL